MSKYIFKKEDRTVTISKVEDKWNYRKEFGTTLIENCNFTKDKLIGLITELKDIGYQIVKEPNVYLNDQLSPPVLTTVEVSTSGETINVKYINECIKNILKTNTWEDILFGSASFKQNSTVNINGVDHPIGFIYTKNDVCINLKYTHQPIKENFVLTFDLDKE